MTREQRIARYTAAAASRVAIAENYVEPMRHVYEGLLDGTPAYTAASLERLVLENKKRFKLELEKALLAATDNARELAETVLATPDPVVAGVDVAWDLANGDALSFTQWQSFSVAEIEGEEITSELIDIIRGAIQSAIEDGTPIREFLAGVLDSAGVGKIHNHHLRTVINNNTATAYSASTLYAFERNKAHFPGWELLAVLDNATRDAHEDLHGKKFKHGDWRYWPPLDHNCRCTASPIDEIEWEEEGYTFDEVDVEVAPEFKNNAVENFAAWVDEKEKVLPPNVRQAIEQRSPTKGQKS